MPIDTRNIIGVDSDKYDPRAPDRPHYNSTPYREAKFAAPPLWMIVTLVIGSLPIVGVLAWALVRLFNWIGEINHIADTYDGAFLTFIKMVLTIATAVIFVGIALLMLAFVASKLVIRLQNNMPLSLLEVVFAGPYMREWARSTVNDYYIERGKLWDNSSLWALETLDLSRTEAPKLAAPMGDVIDGTPPALLPSGNDSGPYVASLVQAGLINRSGNSLLIGFSEGQSPKYAELDETGFIAIAGYPRVGKSATASFIAAQVAMIPNAEIFIADKHANRHDSLTRRLEPLAPAISAFAGTTDEIKAIIDNWFEIGRDRLLRETNDKFAPAFLIIDEFTAMILLEELPETQLRRVLAGAVEFPKVQTHGLYIAHQFTGRLLGGSLGAPLRRVTTQRIVQRVDPQDAAFLLNNDRKLAARAGSLPEGHAIAFGASFTTPIEVAIPHMTRRDIEYLGGLLPVSNSTQTRPMAPSVSNVSNVTSALASEVARATGNVNGDSASIDDTADGKYAYNQAMHYLRKRKPDGTWFHSIRDVRALTGLRTETVVKAAHEIGRRRGSNDDN